MYDGCLDLISFCRSNYTCQVDRFHTPRQRYRHIINAWLGLTTHPIQSKVITEGASVTAFEPRAYVKFGKES